MLTVNQNDVQSAIRVEPSHMGIQVFLGEVQLMGTIEVYPGWGLDLLPEGVGNTDDVYVTDNAPYARLEQAVAAVVAMHLTQDLRVELPDYM